MVKIEKTNPTVLLPARFSRAGIECQVKAMNLSESFKSLLEAMKSRGANRLYAKILKPNNNSKNQIYLAGSYEILQMFPAEDYKASQGTSTKAGKAGEILKAGIPFSWLSEDGSEDKRAEKATLILYSQYPEVRLSGILAGCPLAPGKIINTKIAGRILLMGIRGGAEPMVFAYALMPDSPAAREIMKLKAKGLFVEEGNEVLFRYCDSGSPVERILKTLSVIDFDRPYETFMLNSQGEQRFIQSRNAPGMTLEGLLGIAANSLPQPDINDWELKAIELRKYPIPHPMARVTLMTAEPDTGLYIDDFPEFMKRYGKQTSTERLDFTGPWTIPKGSYKNLRLLYDPFHSRFCLKSADESGEMAAGWGLTDMVNHWKTKHQHAAFVSYAKNEDKSIRFSPYVGLGQGADLGHFINAVEAGLIVYDPGVNMQMKKGQWVPHKRNQWRTLLQDLPFLYKSFDFYDVRTGEKCSGRLGEGWMKIFGKRNLSTVV